MSHKRQLTPQELSDLSKSVSGDLKWIRSTDLTQCDEDGLRELSSRLRRLLIDGSLQRYRQALGRKGELRVATYLLPKDLADGIVLSQAAGVTRNGVTIAGLRIHDKAVSIDQLRSSYEEARGRPPRAEMVVSRWLSSTCIRVSGTSVTRADVIKFVANKLGGVHVDPTRNTTKDRAFQALDGIRSGGQLMDLDFVYAELAAIGQQFAGSIEEVS